MGLNTKNSDVVPWPTWGACRTYKHYWPMKHSCYLSLTTSFPVAETRRKIVEASWNDDVHWEHCCVVVVVVADEGRGRAVRSGCQRNGVEAAASLVTAAGAEGSRNRSFRETSG